KGALRKSQYPDRGACSGRVLGTAEVHGAHEGIHGTAAEVVCSSSAGACGSGDGAVVTHAPGGHAAGASVGAADVDGGIIGEGGVESHQRVRFWTACRDGVGENCVGLAEVEIIVCGIVECDHVTQINARRSTRRESRD